YLLIPVDWLVYSYNVHRILAGDPAPVVQITEHAISPEGLLTLPPLMQSSEPVIRDGIESLLAEKALDEPQSPNQKPGWTSFQLVHEQLTRRLAPFVPEETQPDSKLRRQAAWQRLRVYAYQWY
ncbi:MAG: hypothetical protein JWM11_306, partial [Planctomycetaceae bacterium]|nr:hypothetical protein [Planctomycetaceae bacterium]